jgi:hypothetical protein
VIDLARNFRHDLSPFSNKSFIFISTMQTWKPVVGYEGIYEVSDIGNVRSVLYRSLRYTKRTEPTELRKRVGKYSVVWLYRNDVKRQKPIHRLVAEAFIGPQPTLDHEINHKNGNGNFNHVDNLEWITHSENMYHSYTLPGRKRVRGENHPKSKLLAEDIPVIRRMKSDGQSYLKIANHFNVSKPLIKNIIAGRAWKHIALPANAE